MAIFTASCTSSPGQSAASTVVGAESTETTTVAEDGIGSEPTIPGGDSGEISTSVPPPSEVATSQAEPAPEPTNYVVPGDAAPGYERIGSRDGVLSFVVPQGWSLRTDQRTSVHFNASVIDLAIDLGGGASFLSAIEGGDADKPGVWVAVVDALAPIENATLDLALLSRGAGRGDCELGATEDYETDLFIGRALTLDQCGVTAHTASLVIGRLRVDERVLIFIEADVVELPDFLDFATLLEELTVDAAALR